MFYILFSVLFISNCNKEELPRYEKVLIEVNDHEITVFDFENEYITHLIKTGRNDTKNQRYFFLNKLIDRELFAQEASKTELINNDFYRTAIDYQRRKSMMDTYFVDEMERILEPPKDDEIRLAFAKSKRKVYVRHLFSLRESDVIEAYQRLENGENFIDVANDFYETTSYDSSAGYLGPISYFGVDNGFAEAAFSTNQGEYTKPVRSRFGYHVLYVEYIEFPAMLAEDEYQYRKKGVKSQLRLRTQTLKADDFVRNLMESLQIEIVPENIIELKNIISAQSDEFISNSSNGDVEAKSDFWDDQLLDNLRTSYDHNVVLATYEFEGEQLTFTYGDYVKWLPYLPFNESKARTGASVGRGLRNEVLFKLAEKQKYSKDPRVEKQVRNKGYSVLSDLYRHKLIKEAIRDTTSVRVPAEFRENLVKSTEKKITASYWKVKAGSMKEAKNIKEEILRNGDPENYESFIRYEDKNVLTQENDYSLINNGITETPVITHSSEDGWIVLKILSKTVSEINGDMDPDELEVRYKVFDSLNSSIKNLRKAAEIEMDTTLFDEIYDLYKQKEESAEVL